jgi:hypothetical protein
MNDKVIKYAKLFCRVCKNWTNKVLVWESSIFRDFACLKCGFITRYPNENYCHIDAKELSIEDDGKGFTTPGS